MYIYYVYIETLKYTLDIHTKTYTHTHKKELWPLFMDRFQVNHGLQSHQEKILVPGDKTTSNFIIICWRCYALTLLLELRLDRDNRNTKVGEKY